MKRFIMSEGVVEARLNEIETVILSMVPALMAGVGAPDSDPAALRLEPTIHPDDAERSAEFRRLSSSLIVDGRATDLEVYNECLLRAGSSMSAIEAESWIRVLTTARLILGARLGLVDDGWEDDGTVERDDPRALAMYILGMIQEDLVDALSEAL